MGQILYSGKLLKKPVIIGDNGLYLGLLEHHLGKPYPVGIPGIAPGHPALVLPVPGYQMVADTFGLPVTD